MAQCPVAQFRALQADQDIQGLHPTTHVPSHCFRCSIPFSDASQVPSLEPFTQPRAVVS